MKRTKPKRTKFERIQRVIAIVMTAALIATTLFGLYQSLIVANLI